MDERSQGEEAEELKAQECGPEAWKHHETSKDHQISIKTLSKSRLWRKISMDWPSASIESWPIQVVADVARSGTAAPIARATRPLGL